MKHKTLYKLSSEGALQNWWVESDFDRYRFLHGIVGGEVVASEWTYATPKNLGRSNETTAEEQCKLEVAAAYKKKLEQGKYSESPNTADLLAAKESYFSPMLAEKFDPDRLDGAFYIQPKFNGVRCVATKDGLWSRKGKEFVNTPHISDALVDFFDNYPDLVLDGELYNHDYKADFNNLISAIKKTKPTAATQAQAAGVVQFYLYDIFDPSNPHMKFGARWNMLDALFSVNLDRHWSMELSPCYRSADIKTSEGLHKRNLAAGYEGSIVRLDEPYRNKRTYNLMKYKDFKDEEFEIADITEGTGNWSGVAKVVWICLPDNDIKSGDYYFDRHSGEIFKATAKTDFTNPDYVRVSKAGVKGDKAYCKKLLEDKAEHIGKLGTVVFFDYTPDNVPLFPIFHAVRDYE